jgi:hypothetical protein
MWIGKIYTGWIQVGKKTNWLEPGWITMWNLIFRQSLGLHIELLFLTGTIESLTC